MKKLFIKMKMESNNREVGNKVNSLIGSQIIHEVPRERRHFETIG